MDGDLLFRCCKQKAVFVRRNERKSYCKKHFMQSVERKVKEIVGKERMVQKGDCIGFGISGGKDSSVALLLMDKILNVRRDVLYFAFTIDEGIAGYRNESLGIAKKLCKKLGVEHKVYKYSKEFGLSLDEKVEQVRKSGGKHAPCSYCGVARRHLLNKVARELGANKLCLGHNLDDEAQSIMMNYIRGDTSRASRLVQSAEGSSKAEGFVRRIKPLKAIPEREVALYAVLAGLDVQETECPYASGVRFDIRDFLNQLEDRYPGSKFSIVSTFERIKGYIKSAEQSKRELRACLVCGEPTSQEVCKACEIWRKS